MDPLSALSLAGNILQFVGFLSDLISSTAEIYNTTAGATKDVVSMEGVYAKLRDLSQTLATSKGSNLGTEDHIEGLNGHIASLGELQETCRVDCDKILDTINGLKTGERPSSRWTSFRVALRTVWKNSKIAKLEERLERTQRVMVLKICAISK